MAVESQADAAPHSAWRPHAMLTLAFVFMALNVVVGRAAHTDVPPVGLSFWRWTLATVIFFPFAAARLREQWRLVAANWKLLLLIATVMVLLGNTLVYVGLQSTTALNGGLIPVSRPVIILILAWLLFRGTVTGHQWLGVAVAMIGVLTVLARGDPAVLTGLDFNRGDLWLIASSVGIACYQVFMGRVPKALHPKAVLQVLMTMGVLLLVPVYVWETLAVRPVEVTWPVVGAVLYVAIFPSIFGIYLLNAGIKAVGPARVSIYNYLQPLFVAVIAVPVLGEALRWYHPVALALVVAGIVISSRRRQTAGAEGAA